VALADLMTIAVALVAGTVGVYVMSFRPLDRRAALLGAGMLLNAGSYFFGPLLQAPAVVRDHINLAMGICFIAFVALFPTRTRWRSPSGAALALCVAQQAAAFAFITFTDVSARPGSELTATDRLLLPAALGAAIAFSLLVLARLQELPDPLDERGRAARLMYISYMGIMLVGGGFIFMQTIFAAVGAGSFPTFFYTTGGMGYLVVSVIVWWLLPAYLAVRSLMRWRWTAPVLLLVAGALSYPPLLLRDDHDPLTFGLLRGWGAFLIPTLIMFALTRWAPFPGEPAGLRPALVMTGLSAVFAYLFAFVAVLVVSPDATMAYVLGPIMGIAAAGGMAAAVLPRARKLALRRVFLEPAASSPDGLAPGTDVLGRYRVTRLLGVGGQGRVYEATDRQRGGARVVLKAVTNEAATAEARILRTLAHPNIVRFVEVVEVTGLTLLVLDYAEGGDLRGLITRRGGRLPTGEAISIGRDVLAGLAAAHGRGIAHRDVKPENVLLDPRGAAMLTDFGAAREAEPGATIRVGGMGTLAYLAPEQARGEPGDARSDVYAAAVLIHEMLTGERPIRVASDDDFLARRAILHDAPRLTLPEEATGLAPTLMRALAKEPDARFQDAAEMLTAMPSPSIRSR